jgi:alpha-mannosidase
VRAAGRALANEHLEVEVDPADGTVTIEADGLRWSGLNRYVDGGDGGDTYNYSPPAVDTVVERPERVDVRVDEAGPVRARTVVTASYRWPARAIGDERSCARRSDDTRLVDVVTTLELRTGERFLRVHVELDHQVRDHRLRAHFPLVHRVDGSDAECAFAVVHRGLTVEGGPHEFGLPTFVSRRFVDVAGDGVGLAVLHDGLLEYEVVDDGRELALTLLRATGYLSRSELSLRPNPAGPLDPLEGPQLQGHLALDYAVLPHRGDWERAQLAAAADELLVPLERVRGGGWPGADVAPTGQALRVDGAEVSAVQRDDTGALVVRVVNLSPAPSEVTLATGPGVPLTGDVIDLTGEPLGAFTGSAPLRPWQLLTVRGTDA